MINVSILIRKRKIILAVERYPNAWRDKILVSLFFFLFYICKTPALSFFHFFWGNASFPFVFRNQRLNGVWYTQRKLQ